MRYILLIANNPESYVNMTPEEQQAMFPEYMQLNQDLVQRGELVAGDPLQGLETATTVRVRDGRRTTTDGPFAETKEVLAGYYVIDVQSLDRALEIAAQIPDARTGSIEVRPLQDIVMPA